MIKAAIICVPIILAGTVAYVAPRVMAGSGASVGPVRQVYHCEPACPGDALLMPPSLPPVRSFGVEHHGAPVTATPIPAPGSLVFVPAVLALAWLRRGPIARHPKAARLAAAGGGSSAGSWRHPHQLGPSRRNPRRAISSEPRA